MYSVTRLIHFCYGHRLLDYAGKCRHPHGHNGRIEIMMSGRALDKRGMVVDFEEIKRTIQRWVDTELDHKMLLNKRDPLVRLLKDLGEPVVAMNANPTVENIARMIYQYAKSRKLPVVRVRLWETENSFAEFA